MKPLILAVAALALAGCQTPQTTLPASVPQGGVDARIGAVSQQLAQECSTLAVGITLVRALNRKPDVVKALDAAEAARARFCAAPPADVNTAITVVAAIAIDVIAVWRANQ